MYLSNTEGYDLWSAAKRQRRVLFALMLRNIRTRFFGNGLGYLVAIAWPLTHILMLVMIFTFMGRTAPYGDSTVLFIGTGVAPFMTFSYLSRMTMLHVMKARPLLAFPEVKILDLLFASVLLEILAAACVIIVLGVIGWFISVDVVPRSIVELAYAFRATVLLGLGLGLLNGVIALAFPPWFTGYSLIVITTWTTAGVFFVPDALPNGIREVVAYQPVLQCVEWTREAYYEGYGNLVLDRGYVIGFGLVALFLGLLLERSMRGHLLALR